MPTTALVGVLRAPPGYDPCYERGKVSKHSTAVFLDLRALCCALGGGPLAQYKEMLPTRSQDEADGRMAPSK